MLENNFVDLFPGLAITGAFLFFYIIILAWSTIWKGIALWKCGNNKQLGWFIVLFIINTAGILEILYLLLFQKKKKNK